MSKLEISRKYICSFNNIYKYNGIVPQEDKIYSSWIHYYSDVIINTLKIIDLKKYQSIRHGDFIENTDENGYRMNGVHMYYKVENNEKIINLSDYPDDYGTIPPCFQIITDFINPYFWLNSESGENAWSDQTYEYSFPQIYNNIKNEQNNDEDNEEEYNEEDNDEEYNEEECCAGYQLSQSYMHNEYVNMPIHLLSNNISLFTHDDYNYYFLSGLYKKQSHCRYFSKISINDLPYFIKITYNSMQYIINTKELFDLDNIEYSRYKDYFIEKNKLNSTTDHKVNNEVNNEVNDKVNNEVNDKINDKIKDEKDKKIIENCEILSDYVHNKYFSNVPFDISKFKFNPMISAESIWFFDKTDKNVDNVDNKKYSSDLVMFKF